MCHYLFEASGQGRFSLIIKSTGFTGCRVRCFFSEACGNAYAHLYEMRAGSACGS